MKVLILDRYYETFLEQFHKKYPRIEQLSFNDYHQQLMQEGFGNSDSMAYYMRKNGWNAQIIVANDSVMLQKWARENDVKTCAFPDMPTLICNRLFKLDWRFGVLEAIVKRAKPDILLVHERNILHDWMIARLKLHVRLVVHIIGSTPAPWRDFRSVDLIISCLQSYVDSFRAGKMKAEYLRLAADPRRVEEAGGIGNVPAYDIVFVGGVSRMHRRRIELLERVAERFPLTWFGYGLQCLPKNSRLRTCYRGSVWGLEMYRILTQSKLSLNCHVDVAAQAAANVRMFETTVAGSCLLTDWKEDFSNFFREGSEAVVYRDESSLVEQITYLLAHEQERAQIASQGRARALRDHTYDQRVPELMSILTRHL